MRSPPLAAAPKPTPPTIIPGSPLAPMRLILVDETDRLRVSSLEQLRDLFGRNAIGVVLIGMPGIEKRLAHYPQLYSRVGFVHAFRPLRSEEIRHLVARNWPEIGGALPSSGMSDQDALAAGIRITGGQLPPPRRLLSQVAPILRINDLSEVTAPLSKRRAKAW
jgi:DNA transposition AAA+ family ATPase